jgi:hypothetical protein
MKCLKSGMNDLAGVRSESVLVHTIAATPTIIVPKMLSHR